jgi:hypothetical protein
LRVALVASDGEPGSSTTLSPGARLGSIVFSIPDGPVVTSGVTELTMRRCGEVP